MRFFKKAALILTAALMITSTACAVSGDANPAAIRLASLKGPTTMGMIKLMDDDAKADKHKYAVSLFGTPDEIVAGIVDGSIDIANVPANLAAVLFNRTNGGIKVAAINTLGVLYIVESTHSLQGVSDLRGRTVYSTGKGTTPEYALNYVLSQNGLDPETDLTIEYLSESAEVAARLSEDKTAIGCLPMPYVAVAQTANPDLRMAISLGAEFDRLGTALVTGVTIVRTDFLNENAKAVDSFLKEYVASGEYVNNNQDAAAELIGAFEIVPTPVAKKALPFCSIHVETGDGIKTPLQSYLSLLYDYNPQSVGGTLPDDTLFYSGK